MGKRNSEMDTRNAKQQKTEENFTLKILKAKEGNQIFSPINIAHAFGLLLYGACGDTKKEIVRILGYGELKPLQQAIRKAFGTSRSKPISIKLKYQSMYHKLMTIILSLSI